MKLILTTIQPDEKWTVEMIQTMSTAYEKAITIEKKINEIAVRLVMSPLLNEKYPEIMEQLRKSYSVEHPKQEQEDELAKLTRILNKQDSVDLTIEEAKKVCETMADLEKSKPIEQRNFLEAYRGYLERNELSYKEEPLKSALFAQGNILKPQDLVEMIEKLDTKDLTSLCGYQRFFSPLEYALTCLGCSEFTPHSAGTSSNNPSSVYQTGLLQGKQLQNFCKNYMNKAGFKERTIKEINTWNARCLTYKGATEISEKFKIAWEIRDVLSMQPHSPTIALDAYCVLSLQSPQIPLYYRKYAIDLAQEIKDFNPPKDGGPIGPIDCVII